MKWVLMILVAGALTCGAADYYVASDGSDLAGNGSSGNPWKTISNGVSHAVVAGDVVNVATGVYVLTQQISITKDITLRGQNRTNTVIMGPYTPVSGNSRGLSITSAGATVEEFTVTGFVVSDAWGNGAGVLMTAGTLRACIISNNGAINPSGDCRGGGIYSAGAGIISNCAVVNNRASKGGGIYCQDGTMIHGSFIRNNSTLSQGGGIYSGPGAQIVRNSEISGNSAPANYGGGILLYNGSLLLTNCVISSNSCKIYGGGIEAGLYANLGLTAVACRIVDNIVTNGFGAGVYGKNCVLDHCVIQGNVITNGMAGRAGAGIYLMAGGAGTIRNCLIVDNRVSDTGTLGGGMHVEAGATSQVTACTIAGNYAYNQGGGVYLAGDGGVTFTNCIIASNTISAVGAGNNIYMTTATQSNSFYYSCSERLTNTLQGNITSAPVFVDYAADDYRLQSGSPGINAGWNQPWMGNAVDLQGQSRLDRFSRVVDMGCYEHVPRGNLYVIW